MKGNLYLKTAPTTEPVTVAEIKSHMRVDISDDDTLITSLGVAARRWIENITGIRMMTQTWNHLLDNFPGESVIKIPVGPVLSITSVNYTDSLGVVATFAAANYDTDLVSLPARISLKSGCSWPTSSLKSVNGVDVEFVAGYHATATTVTSVPEELKLAIKMLASYWYENRDAAASGIGSTEIKELPLSLQALIGQFLMYQREL